MAQRLYKDQGTTWNLSLTPNGPLGGRTLLAVHTGPPVYCTDRFTLDAGPDKTRSVDSNATANSRCSPSSQTPDRMDRLYAHFEEDSPPRA